MSEEVVVDLQADGIENAKCVTQHPRFNPVCLQKWSLKLAADKYKTKNKKKYSQVGTQNRLDNLYFCCYSNRFRTCCLGEQQSASASS